MQYLDSVLNRMTMYRVLLYGLGMIAGASVLFGLTGTLGFSAPGLLASLGVLMAVCYGANKLFAALFGAASSSESALITALILFCIMTPPSTPYKAALLGLTSLLAIASKYLIAYHERHIFNPAAAGAVIAGLLGLARASWWVATPVLLPFVLLGGLLAVRKIRRFPMVLCFAAAAMAMLVLTGLRDGWPLDMLVRDGFVSYPLAFFGLFMLTEPLTTPPTRRHRLIYAALAGVLFGSRLRVGSFGLTPELALVLANGYAFTTVLRRRLVLTLVGKTPLSQSIYEYRFKPSAPVRFRPGQYLELTMPGVKPDARGTHRTFTIASSPAEQDIRFGIRFYEPSSAFKRKLKALKAGQQLYANQLAGDFTLPAARQAKLAFIAGGIGITPYRSMLQHLVDSGEQRDIVLFYAVGDPQDMVYQDVIARAERVAGLRTVPVLAPPQGQSVPADWPGETGFITAAMLRKRLPDYQERIFYLSGPDAMVRSYRRLLRGLGVPRHRIVTDYFTGY